MLRTAAVFAALLLIGSSPAGAFSGGVASDVAARAKVMRFLDKALGGADRGAVKIDLVDLNADGVPEAIAKVSGPRLCGAEGCGFILDLGGAEAAELGGYRSRRLAALRSNTNGWRDVAISDRRVTFSKGRYGS